jgi:hypothetical protein
VKPSGLRAIVAATALVMSGCAQAGTSASVESPAAVEPSDSAQPSATPAPPNCPTGGGGSCLGPLEPGTYTTEEMVIPITYTVPEGWANYEDLPGNFLLVPPSGTLAGVNPGTSDFIGVYIGVAAAMGDCGEAPQPDVDTTPEAMMAWYADLPGLNMSAPKTVELGGLNGLVSDLEVDEAHATFCPYEGFEDVPLVPLVVGVGPAGLHHVVIPGSITRLYLFLAPSSTSQTIAIEITEIEGGDSLDDLDAVVQTFEFGD